MLELGDYEETLHRAVGAHLLKKNIDLVLTVGPAARYISDEVNKSRKIRNKIEENINESDC